MEKELMNEVQNGMKYWYVPVILGIIFLGAGIYTFSQPLEAYLDLAMIFGMVCLAFGVFEIFMAFSAKAFSPSGIIMFIFGVISTVFGFYLVSNPVLSMEILPYYVGAVILFRSFSGLSYYSSLQSKGVQGTGSLLLMSIIGIILGVFIIFNPSFGGMTIIIWTGAGFIISGVLSIFLGFRLKGLKNHLQ